MRCVEISFVTNRLTTLNAVESLGKGLIATMLKDMCVFIDINAHYSKHLYKYHIYLYNTYLPLPLLFWWYFGVAGVLF